MRRLGEIAEILAGVAPERSISGPAQFLQIGDLREGDGPLITGAVPMVTRATPVRPGDVLVASRGSPAVIAEARQSFLGAYVTPDVYLVRPDKRHLEPGYLLAYLRLPAVQSRLREATAGSHVPRIPRPALDELEVPLPPIERQRTIGELVARFDLRSRQLEKRAALEFQLHAAALNQLFEDL
jgi:type I restriction modification DNA specificity protein